MFGVSWTWKVFTSIDYNESTKCRMKTCLILCYWMPHLSPIVKTLPTKMIPDTQVFFLWSLTYRDYINSTTRYLNNFCYEDLLYVVIIGITKWITIFILISDESYLRRPATDAIGDLKSMWRRKENLKDLCIILEYTNAF